MDTIVSYLNNLNISLDSSWIVTLIIFGSILLIGFLSRLLFGKHSTFNAAISSAIGILFIYVITIVLNSIGDQFQHFVAPLPFVSLGLDRLILFPFTEAHYTAVCSELLNMIILAFLVNLIDSFLPKGKKLFSWLFYRCLTVILGLIVHVFIVGVLSKYLPGTIATYAPVILLAILVLLLLTGVLKLFVGVLLGVMNPIIGALYTFFFASLVGKQITKAVLSTVILAAIVIILSYFNINVILLSQDAVVGYLPTAIMLPVLWYFVSKVF